MNILLCFNDKFVPLARTLIISLMCHHEELHFYVGYTNLNEANRQGLKELVEDKCPSGAWPWDEGEFCKNSPQRTIEFVQFTPPTNLYLCGRFSYDIWTRCFIWEQLQVDRLLYLDADVIVDSNLERFYHDDLGDSLLKACPEYGCYGTGFVNIKGFNSLVRLHDENGFRNEFGTYCNSGVLLFNLARMREEGITAQLMLDYYQQLHKPLRMPDQDFLNLFFEGRIKLANPYRYNCLVAPLNYMIGRYFNDFSQIDMDEAPYPCPAQQAPKRAAQGVKYNPRDIVIYHYNTGRKPNEPGYHHKHAGVFWRYHLMDPHNCSDYAWVRRWQAIWGPIRRLIPEIPLAIKRKKAGDYLVTNAKNMKQEG